MPFQPFGYRFEVRSELSPDAVKAAIRSRKKGWFDLKNGARGWIVGSFIYLWWTAWGGSAVLIGWSSKDTFGTRVSGRAGHMIAGMLLLLVPSPFFIVCYMLATGDYTLENLAILLGVFALFAFITSVFGIDQHDADPLVRFLRNTIEKPEGHPRAKPVALPDASKLSKSLTLEDSGSVLDGPVTPALVRDTLQDVASDGFVILSSQEERYVQTVPQLDGYVVEKRDGDDAHHYRAARRGSSDKQDVFTLEETLAIFLACGSGAPMPSFVEWKKTRA